jgi:acyl-coenzyme A synthetase/AMP-(fatty) acid ligase
MKPKQEGQDVERFRWQIPADFNFATDVVDAWARRDKLALLWENSAGETKQFTFSDISRLSNQLANVLTELGIKPGDRVMTLLPRIPEWHVAMLAILKIRAIAVPCLDMLKPGDIAYRLQDSGARAAIVHPSTLPAILTVKSQFPGLQHVLCTGAPNADSISLDATMATAAAVYPVSRGSAEDAAVMYYSSGTTGYPKGILHAQRALYAWRVQAEQWLALKPNDIIFPSTGTGWAFAGTTMLFGPWSCGSCVLMYDGPFDPVKRLELLERYKATTYAAVPTELRMLLKENVRKYDLSALKRIATGGEAVTKVLIEQWQELTGITPAESYGQTESLIVCANTPGMPLKVGSMGKPMPGYVVTLMDTDRNEVGNNTPGIIAIRGDCPALFLRYWQNEEQTQAANHNGWYLSGDVAWRDDDGYYWFTERADDIISSAGYRIGPNDVERTLYRHPAIQECAAVGSPDPVRGEVVKAFIVLRAGYEPSEALATAIETFAKAESAPYMYPRRIEFVASLPRTDTGKLKRSELRLRERAAAAQLNQGCGTAKAGSEP